MPPTYSDRAGSAERAPDLLSMSYLSPPCHSRSSCFLRSAAGFKDTLCSLRRVSGVFGLFRLLCNGVRFSPVRFAGLLGLLSTVAALYSLLVGGIIDGTLKDLRLDLGQKLPPCR